MLAEAVALEVLSDESMLRILHLSSFEPMSLPDLSLACGITGAACFRRLSELKRMGLVEEVEREARSDEEKRLFSSNVKRIELKFMDGHIYTTIEGEHGSSRSACIDPISGLTVPWDGEAGEAPSRDLMQYPMF